MKERAHITTYNNNFCVLMPIYYQHETRPAWRKYYTGSRENCIKILGSAPEYLNATPEEERRNRENIIKEIIFYQNRGNVKKAAALKAQYNI